MALDQLLTQLEIKTFGPGFTRLNEQPVSYTHLTLPTTSTV